MDKAILLRVHRWTTLVFALPLLVVIVTGLILAVKPAVTQAAIAPGSVTAGRLEQILAQHDPQRAARGLFFSPLDHTVTLIPGTPGIGSAAIHLNTGAAAEPSVWPEVFRTARRVHERFVFNAHWLVLASTVAMLVLICLGMLMGLPRLRNTVSGWHGCVGWFLLPLLIASPLTGLLMALGVTFAPAPVRERGPQPDLVEAIRLTAASHDLSAVSWIRPRAGQMLVRIAEGGTPTVYAVKHGGLEPLPSNWPRLLHEGTYGSALGSVVTLLTALAAGGLLISGLIVWARRRFRKPTRVRGAAGTLRPGV